MFYTYLSSHFPICLLYWFSLYSQISLIGLINTRRNVRSRVEWHMWFGTFSKWKEGSRLSLGLHSESRSRWCSCPFESSFGGQRVFLALWHCLSGDHPCYWLLPVISTWHQECLTSWHSWHVEQPCGPIAQEKSGQVWCLWNFYMGWSSLLKHSLQDSPQLFRSLDFVLKSIILSSFDFIKENEFSCSFMWWHSDYWWWYPGD